jgi:isocitrate dehydrogenase kinase/phosphatase
MSDKKEKKELKGTVSQYNQKSVKLKKHYYNVGNESKERSEFNDTFMDLAKFNKQLIKELAKETPFKLSVETEDDEEDN